MYKTARESLKPKRKSVTPADLTYTTTTLNLLYSCTVVIRLCECETSTSGWCAVLSWISVYVCIHYCILCIMYNSGCCITFCTYRLAKCSMDTRVLFFFFWCVVLYTIITRFTYVYVFRLLRLRDVCNRHSL